MKMALDMHNTFSNCHLLQLLLQLFQVLFWICKLNSGEYGQMKNLPDTYHVNVFSQFKANVLILKLKINSLHYVMSVRIWSFSISYFPTFGVNTDIYKENLRI